MDEKKQDKINEILDDLQKDVRRPPYDTDEDENYYSRVYQKYKEEEISAREKNRYEKLCYKFANLLHLEVGEDLHDKFTKPINLLGWEITPGMVLSATVGIFFISFGAWFMLFITNVLLGTIIPTTIILLFLSIPIVATYYTYKKPFFAAQNKVIRSSSEMILSILYMVVYMRSTPNLEGAVRFAALNLDGPISKDLKGVLWDLEVGKYKQIENAMENYTENWKDYNDDYLESLNLLKAAMNEPNDQRRESLLQDSIDNILEGTKEKMKHYAQSLETPVMIINAMGAMLPVLGMIMLPLISAFLGGVITPLHLIVIFNILLPGFLYWFMQRTLSSRPPTIETKAVDEETLPPRGKYTFETMGKTLSIPTWPIGATVFLIISAFGILSYLSFPHFYPKTNFDPASVPQMFLKKGSEGQASLAPIPMLLRSISITFGLGMGIGVSKTLGNIQRKKAEEDLSQIESQFPEALFELGNKISGGTPIEMALKDAAESTDDLEISNLFGEASENIRKMGMTFEEAIFDPKYGALRKFPSQLIQTVLKAILESSEKGTDMASKAMMTISRYLENIHQTQETLNDLMDDTTTTIQMLAYLLAPVISGVAVGMSQTLITALFKLSVTFGKTKQNLPGSGSSALGAGGILSNLKSAIPPELMQLVVGIYLIQLLHILGIFYMKITHGEDKTYKKLFTGKILISGIFFYTITLLIVSLLFGGIVNSISV